MDLYVFYCIKKQLKNRSNTLEEDTLIIYCIDILTSLAFILESTAVFSFYLSMCIVFDYK